MYIYLYLYQETVKPGVTQAPIQHNVFCCVMFSQLFRSGRHESIYGFELCCILVSCLTNIFHSTFCN